jgi:hypothetical protein
LNKSLLRVQGPPDLNSDSGPRGDHGGETQKTWSPIHIKDKYDYNLNKSSIRVQDHPVSTISRIKGITMSNDTTSGNNGGNEDDTKHALYTSSKYRTPKPLLEDTDNRNNTLQSPNTDSYAHGSLKGSSNQNRNLNHVIHHQYQLKMIQIFHCPLLFLRTLMCM